MTAGRLGPFGDTSRRITVAVVIPTFRRPTALATLLTSLRTGSQQPDEIIVVDNDPDGTARVPLVGTISIRVLRAGLGLNLAGARNMGARAVSSELCVFIDDDNAVDTDALAVLARAFQDSEVAFAGPLIFAADSGKVWCGGVRRSPWSTRTTMLYMGQLEEGLPAATRWPTADMPDCLAVRTSVLRQAGGFDEQAFPFHYDEADLCERLRRAGVQPYVLRAATVRHYGFTESGNAGAELVAAFRRHGVSRVRLMVRARIWYHRRHGVGLSRFTALGIGVPGWIAVAVVLVVSKERDLRVVRMIIWAMARGLLEGYCQRPGPPPTGWAAQPSDQAGAATLR